MTWNELAEQLWIIGVSGGPDSMALLDLCRRHHVRLIVGHVNYHHRPTAGRDQKIVEAYCRRYALKMEVLRPAAPESGNFQEWARNVRYAFFARLADQFHAYGVLIAHNLDDFLETALMQQESGRTTEVRGIRTEGRVLGVLTVRPLLNRTKQELREYCGRHGVAYGIDESNLGDDYRRNQIRHQIVEPMSEAEKRAEVRKWKRQNQSLRKKTENLRIRLNPANPAISREMFLNLALSDQTLFLRLWLQEHKVTPASQAQLTEIAKALGTKADNFSMPVSSGVILTLNYGIFSLDFDPEVSYCYVLDKIELLSTPYFKVAAQGLSVEAVTLEPEDWPITIRSPKPGDQIRLRFGTKKLNRWFIDRKIPLSQRRVWPVVLNCRDEVILIPKIGCNVSHYSNNPNCFVIKC